MVEQQKKAHWGWDSEQSEEGKVPTKGLWGQTQERVWAADDDKRRQKALEWDQWTQQEGAHWWVPICTNCGGDQMPFMGHVNLEGVESCEKRWEGSEKRGEGSGKRREGSEKRRWKNRCGDARCIKRSATEGPFQQEQKTFWASGQVQWGDRERNGSSWQAGALDKRASFWPITSPKEARSKEGLHGLGWLYRGGGRGGATNKENKGGTFQQQQGHQSPCWKGSEEHPW